MAAKAVDSDEEVPNPLEDRLVRQLAEPPLENLNKEAGALLKAMSTMFPTHVPKVSKPSAPCFQAAASKVQYRRRRPASSSASGAGPSTRVM